MCAPLLLRPGVWDMGCKAFLQSSLSPVGRSQVPPVPGAVFWVFGEGGCLESQPWKDWTEGGKSPSSPV